MLNNGDDINGNVIHNFIGGGSYGLVYKARSGNLNIDVALKECKPTATNEEKERFEQENDILHTLHLHANVIIPYSRIETSNNIIFYLMELADYDLEKYFYTHTVNPNVDYLDRVQIFKKICSAVKHAHERDIVHRDLYWKNILIKMENNTREPKLNDFGMAKDFNLANLTNIPLDKWGAPFVTSPEILFKIWEDREIDKYILADVYALGMVFSYIFNGMPMLYIQAIHDSLTRYLTTNNISIDSLSFSERKTKYNEWINIIAVANPANYLFVNLVDSTISSKINSILRKLCFIDYSLRYQTVNEVLTDLNNI